MNNENWNNQQLATVNNHRQIIRNHENQVENFKRLKRISFDFDPISDHKKENKDLFYGSGEENTFDRKMLVSNNYPLQRRAQNVLENNSENNCKGNIERLQYISWYIQVIVFPGLLLFIILYEANISILTKLYAMVIYVIFVLLLFINSPHVNRNVTNDKNYELLNTENTYASRKLNVIPETLDLDDATREPIINNDGKLGFDENEDVSHKIIPNSNKYIDIMRSMGKLLTNIVI